MTTPEKIQDILRDLYALDPDFKKHEQKLVTIITQLVASRPEVTVDEAFAHTLRQRLAAQATIQQPAHMPSHRFSWLTTTFATLAIIGLVTTTVVYKQKTNLSSFESAVSQIDGKTSIVSTKPQAFGSLATVTAGGKGGGGTEGSASAAAAAPQATDGKMIAPSSMPVMVQYTFVYKGGQIELKDNSASVYLRSRNAFPELQKSLLSRLNLKSFGFTNFTNPQMETVSFHDDRDFGYTATIDFLNGSITLNQNWQRWPNDYTECNYNSECLKQHYAANPVSDADLVSIANNFFKDQGISLAEYGDPEMQAGWDQIKANLTTDPNSAPPYASVVYPRKIKGETVLDEAGNPAGLVVNISLWHKRVAGVFDYGPLRLEESKYDTVTDFKRLVAVAEGNSYTGDMPGSTKVTVTLGTPVHGLVRSWLQKPNEQTGNEVYSPALLFPATSSDPAHPYNKYVVVPLVKEILDSQSQQPPIGIMEKAQ